MGRFISAAVLRDLAKLDKNVVLEEDSVLTPSAKDLAKELGITISKGRQEIVSRSVVSQSTEPLANQKSSVKEVSVSSGNSTDAGSQSEDL
ncbi:MAG: ethanolamine utilization protein, partial [Peptococcaceae bacterium BRH_c23]